MRKIIASAIFSIAGGIIVPTVVPMMVPQISLSLGWRILGGCAVACLIAVALLIPEIREWWHSLHQASERDQPKRDLRNPPPVVGRLPIQELLKAAETDGWEFKGSKNVLYYFGLALKQSAADGAVEIQGRISRRGSSASLAMMGAELNNSLAPIPKDFFREHFISHAGLHGAWLPGGVNHQTKVSDMLEKEEIQYIDLHVMKPQAWDWLFGEARKVRDRAMEEERTRRAALESGTPFTVRGMMERAQHERLEIRKAEAQERVRIEAERASASDDRKAKTLSLIWEKTAGDRITLADLIRKSTRADLSYSPDDWVIRYSEEEIRLIDRMRKIDAEVAAKYAVYSVTTDGFCNYRPKRESFETEELFRDALRTYHHEHSARLLAASDDLVSYLLTFEPPKYVLA